MYEIKKRGYEARAERSRQKWADRKGYDKCIDTICQVVESMLHMPPYSNKNFFDKPKEDDTHMSAIFMLAGCTWPVFVRAHKRFYRVAIGKEMNGTPVRVRELALKLKEHIGYEKPEHGRRVINPTPEHEGELSGRFYVNGGKITLDLSPEILAAMAQNH